MTEQVFALREATVRDAQIIVDMIRELAEFENLLADCETSVEKLTQSAFPPDGGKPLISILIAEETKSESICGFCLYFYNYSTFTGRPGIYLEDLFIREKFRGKGLGTLFFERLKETARDKKCTRLEWAVIDWNEKARTFYTQRMKAQEKSEWILNRLDKDGLLPLQ